MVQPKLSRIRYLAWNSGRNHTKPSNQICKYHQKKKKKPPVALYEVSRPNSEENFLLFKNYMHKCFTNYTFKWTRYRGRDRRIPPDNGVGCSNVLKITFKCKEYLLNLENQTKASQASKKKMINLTNILWVHKLYPQPPSDPITHGLQEHPHPMFSTPMHMENWHGIRFLYQISLLL